MKKLLSTLLVVATIPAFSAPALAEIINLKTKSGETQVTLDTETAVIRYTAKGAGQNIRGTLQSYSYDEGTMTLKAVGRESNSANGEECKVDFKLRITGGQLFTDWSMSSITGYRCSAAGQSLKDVELVPVSVASSGPSTSSSSSGIYAPTRYGRTTVYDAPGYSNAKFSLPEGTRVEVLGEAAKNSSIYFKIRHNGRVGWIDSVSLDY